MSPNTTTRAPVYHSQSAQLRDHPGQCGLLCCCNTNLLGGPGHMIWSVADRWPFLPPADTGPETRWVECQGSLRLCLAVRLDFGVDRTNRRRWGYPSRDRRVHGSPATGRRRR